LLVKRNNFFYQEGEENSEGEDTSTAIPVTAEAGQDAVVIATGHHIGVTCQDTVKSSDIPRKPGTREKRKKKQNISKDSKKAHSDMNEDIFASGKIN